MKLVVVTLRCVLKVAVFCQKQTCMDGWKDGFTTQHEGPIHSHLSRWTSLLTDLLFSPTTCIVELILKIKRFPNELIKNI